MTTATKKINRGHLVRAAKRGQLFVKCRFHMTDDYAFDNAVGFGKMDEFKQAYFRYPHTSPLETRIDDMYAAGASHEDVEPLMEELRRERFDHNGQEEQKAQGKITVRLSDFRTKSGHVSGDATSGNFSIHSNLNYDYEIRS